jgi:hypothetical protein
MCPFTHANYFVLAGTIVASFMFGYLWYGPIFGKLWAELMGIKMDGKCGPKPWAIALTLLGVIFTTFVMAYILNIYKPYCSYGAAFFIWLGFCLPILFSQVTWEGKPWKLFVLNASYYFLNLQLIAAILSYFR